jgi:hypothetical protein
MKPFKFKRWGSLVPQSHTPNSEDFNAAPVKYGIYAFPIYYMEEFLLGGVGNGSIKNGRWKFLKDKNGKKLKARYIDLFNESKDKKHNHYREWKDEYKELFKDINPDSVSRYYPNKEECLIAWEEEILIESNWLIENKPNIFEYSGNVWCHFSPVAKRNEILSESGGWILVDMLTYRKLLKKIY